MRKSIKLSEHVGEHTDAGALCFAAAGSGGISGITIGEGGAEVCSEALQLAMRHTQLISNTFSCLSFFVFSIKGLQALPVTLIGLGHQALQTLAGQSLLHLAVLGELLCSPGSPGAGVASLGPLRGSEQQCAGQASGQGWYQQAIQQRAHDTNARAAA